jgi:hypothetical protein
MASTSTSPRQKLWNSTPENSLNPSLLKAKLLKKEVQELNSSHNELYVPALLRIGVCLHYLKTSGSPPRIFKSNALKENSSKIYYEK